jgi:hypothetical protein
LSPAHGEPDRVYGSPVPMHQTTVRFDEEHWRELKLASRRAGVPAAQYIRDATVARLARSTQLTEVVALRRDVDQLQIQVSRALGRRWAP